jgi:hypothetical protein
MFRRSGYRFAVVIDAPADAIRRSTPNDLLINRAE